MLIASINDLMPLSCDRNSILIWDGKLLTNNTTKHNKTKQSMDRVTELNRTLSFAANSFRFSFNTFDMVSYTFVA